MIIQDIFSLHIHMSEDTGGLDFIVEGGLGDAGLSNAFRVYIQGNRDGLDYIVKNALTIRASYCVFLSRLWDFPLLENASMICKIWMCMPFFIITYCIVFGGGPLTNLTKYQGRPASYILFRICGRQ